MENFAPGLRATIVSLTETLRVVVYFVCVAGLMLQMHRARHDLESLTRPIVRAILIVGLVATLPHWFAFTETSFLTVADVVNHGYTAEPMKAAAELRRTITESDGEFTLRRLGESLYRAVVWATAKLVVLVASLLQLPFLLLQYLLKLLCYLFLPIALGLLLIPSLASLGMRYVQQTVAILAWPVGFAVTELVAFHLLNSFNQNVAGAFGLTPRDLDAASFASLLGGLAAALWIILGTLGTPFLMQSLICSGTPLTAAGGSGLQKLFALQQISHVLRSTRATGALAASRAPEPPAPPAGPPPPSAANVRVHATVAPVTVPSPHTTI